MTAGKIFALPRKRTLRQLLTYALIAMALYLVLGALLPLLRHRGVSGEFAASFSPADCRSETFGGERVQLIDDNTDALLWRLRLIDGAQEEILYSTMDFRDDESGRDVLSALYAAAERGVQVRLVVDGLTSPRRLARSGFYAALAAHPNAQVRAYNRLDPLRPWRANMRLHDKYLICDHKAFLLGGRNTNDLFLGEYDGRKNQDLELLVCRDEGAEGGSLSQLREYFSAVWALDCTRPFRARVEQTAPREIGERMISLERRYPDAYDGRDWREDTLPANRVTLLSNPIQPESKEPRLWYSLCALMAEGERVTVETPYLICGRAMYAELAQVCRDTQVEMITNAVETGANPWGCADYLNQRGRILRTGVTVYEAQGERSRHSKCVLIDGEIAVVGSFNMDMRSAYLDTELMLAVDCPALCGQLAQDAERAKAASRAVTAEGVTVGENFPDALYPLPKRALYGLLRVLILPARSAL